MRIGFLVTHLLGTGHLARTGALADAFAAAGHDALVLSGGLPAPLAAPKAAALRQLPPLRSDAGFTALLDAEDREAGPDLLAARIREIGTTLYAFAPEVLVTELFPFGRRKLAVEFEAGIAAARGALTLCSIRDILQRPRKPGRKAEAEARLARYYDGILFHGDGALAGLEESWPLPDTLRPMVRETGYIGERTIPEAGGTDGLGEIVVAAGGGATGEALFRAAAGAAHAMPERRWRLLGPLRHDIALPPNAVAEAARSDFRTLLARCDAAVLQCGYNTAMDVAAADARVVWCPFEGEGETEQMQRARAMTARFGGAIVRERDLSPDALTAALRTVVEEPRPDHSALRLDGAARSVRIVEDILA